MTAQICVQISVVSGGVPPIYLEHNTLQLLKLSIVFGLHGLVW